MLPLLLALALSTARAACPIDAENPIRADGVIVTVGADVYSLRKAADRAQLAGVLSACNLGRAPDHLADYSAAHRKTSIRAISGLVFWPIWLLVIPPAIAQNDALAALNATINQ